MKGRDTAVKLILCLFPVSVIYLVQMGLSYVLPVIFDLISSMTGRPWTDFFPDSGNNVIFFVYELICMIIVMMAYYGVYGRKKEKSAENRFYHVSTVFVFLLLACGIYFCVAVYLDLASLLAPRQMTQYGEMIESSGLAGLTFLSTVITLVIAPVFEELLFRGLMLKTAAWVKLPFWAANLLQAFVFGLFHMNWIQGIYAFGLGLVLGGCYRWYGVIAAPILLHGIFNYFGTYVAGTLHFIPEGLAGNVMLLSAGILLVAAAEFIRKKTKR